jgi:selenide,water dikinase
VYQITDDLALVQTVDFITPVVDDPHSFGAIAVANSISDIYAMGAKPLIALNLIGFPNNTLPLEILTGILQGGAEKAIEAQVTIVGGHTINDPEPKYGLAVTGLIHPNKIISNAGAKIGDVLILTKPLGIGIITTALKKEEASTEIADKAIATMTFLNRSASEAMLEVGVNACTDITGFGLLGHLQEMTAGSGVGAEVYLEKIPVIEGTHDLVKKGIAPGGTHANRNFLLESVTWHPKITLEEQLILCDAQTSGGLLISVPAHKEDQLLTLLKDRHTPAAVTIGRIIEEPEGKIRVLP